MLTPLRAVAPLVLVLPLAAQTLHVERAQSAREAEPARIELAGAGAGTIVLPGPMTGRFVALLPDAATGLVLQLDASVVTYSFLLAHDPAGAFEGGLYTTVDPESTDEPRLVAEVRGEWAVDGTGQGTLAGLFLHLQPGAEPQIAGALQGAFHVDYSAPPVIAPPFYAENPVDVPTSAAHVRSTGSARAGLPELDDALPPPAPASAPILRPGVPSLDAPTVVVDPGPPSWVARVRIVWQLQV